MLAVHTFQFFPALRSHLRNPEKQIAFGVHLLSNPQKYIKQRFKAIAKISACFSQKIIAYLNRDLTSISVLEKRKLKDRNDVKAFYFWLNCSSKVSDKI